MFLYFEASIISAIVILLSPIVQRSCFRLLVISYTLANVCKGVEFLSHSIMANPLQTCACFGQCLQLTSALDFSFYLLLSVPILHSHYGALKRKVILWKFHNINKKLILFFLCFFSTSLKKYNRNIYVRTLIFST